MNIQVSAENAFARKVNVTVPAAAVASEFDLAYTELGARARLPGFRPGKVPRKVLETRFGEKVSADVAQALVQKAYTQALADHKLEPVSRPNVVDSSEPAAGKAFTFTIAVDVKPTVTLGTYTGLSVYWPPSEVAASEIDGSIEARRQRAARFVEVDDRAVAEGDTAQVALKITSGDETVAEEPGTLIKTKGEGWYKGLESFVIGLSKGEKKAGEVTFAANARNKVVAGKTLTVEAEVLSIQAQAVPELTDALAAELGFADLADLRAKTEAELGKGRADMSRNLARANLLQALIDANNFEVPRGMVEQNLQLLQEELKLQQAYAGRDPRTISFSKAQLDDLRVRAGFAAKGALLLEAVWTTEGIVVSDDDLEAKYQQLADERGQSVEAIRGYFVKDDAVEDLRQRILEEKTLDWLLAQATITDRKSVV